MRQQEVALAHDYLLVMRGAERTFSAMAECWTDAPIHTTLFDPVGTEGRFAGRDIRTSYLQQLNVRQQGFRKLLPLFPGAVEGLNLGTPDVVVSSSSAFAHGVRIPDEALHVCYCHSPFRYAWHERQTAQREVPAIARPLLDAMLRRTRRWDLAASQRVTHYLANSRITQRRIEEFYGRDSTILHPPVEIDRFTVGEPEDYFLTVSEIVGHKRVEMILEAARIAGKKVKVVGDGPERERLTAKFPEAEFLGRLNDSQLEDAYRGALALLVGNVEEFGITAVEAQASGRPVVAPSAGGASETVIDGETGILVDEPSVEAYAEILSSVDFTSFSPMAAVTSAERFSVEAFQLRLMFMVDSLAAVDVNPLAAELLSGRSALAAERRAPVPRPASRVPAR
jgi:glycosyltransferase involved in cell wall biosynthesis